MEPLDHNLAQDGTKKAGLHRARFAEEMGLAPTAELTSSDFTICIRSVPVPFPPQSLSSRQMGTGTTPEA